MVARLPDEYEMVDCEYDPRGPVTVKDKYLEVADAVTKGNMELAVAKKKIRSKLNAKARKTATDQLRRKHRSESEELLGKGYMLSQELASIEYPVEKLIEWGKDIARYKNWCRRAMFPHNYTEKMIKKAFPVEYQQLRQDELDNLTEHLFNVMQLEEDQKKFVWDGGLQDWIRAHF